MVFWDGTKSRPSGSLHPVEILVSADLQVYASPVQLQQAIMNLVLNAREAMLPHGGKLTISAQADNDGIRIKISDTGCGIEQSEISRVFDTFFTTKHKRISRRRRHRPRPCALQKGYRRSRRNNNRRFPPRQRYNFYNHPAEKIITAFPSRRVVHLAQQVNKKVIFLFPWYAVTRLAV